MIHVAIFIGAPFAVILILLFAAGPTIDRNLADIDGHDDAPELHDDDPHDDPNRHVRETGCPGCRTMIQACRREAARLDWIDETQALYDAPSAARS